MGPAVLHLAAARRADRTVVGGVAGSRCGALRGWLIDTNGQSVTFGTALANLDKFAYIGVFSSGLLGGGGARGRGAAPAAGAPAAPARQPVENTRGLAAMLLEWITLAACRTGEARFATWGEIDLDRKVWSIPAARMKMRRSHRVPLSSRAIEILQDSVFY